MTNLSGDADRAPDSFDLFAGYSVETILVSQYYFSI